MASDILLPDTEDTTRRSDRPDPLSPAVVKLLQLWAQGSPEGPKKTMESVWALDAIYMEVFRMFQNPYIYIYIYICSLEMTHPDSPS